MPEIRRRYDPEFRSGAVRIVLETGKPIIQVGVRLACGLVESPRVFRRVRCATALRGWYSAREK